MKHAWVALIVLGCGGGGTHGSVALDDFGLQLGASYCTKEFSCCTSAEVMMDFGSFTVGGQPITTEQQCETFYAGLVGALLGQQAMDSIAKGRASYDADAAGGCLDALDGASCSEFGSDIDLIGSGDCKLYLVPLVDDGGACAQSFECKTDNCVGARTQPPTDGQCKPIPGAGEDCLGTCAKGLFCAFDSASSREICKPAQANGESCEGSNDCASGFCDGLTSSGAGTCADKPARCDGN